MLLSIDWLSDFLQPGISVSELADRLTMAGTEVDEIIEIGSQWDNVVVGRIEDITPHPAADKLRVASVSLGSHSDTIVCGAPNIAVGQRVPVALPGAVLPGGTTIKKTKIRGQASAGMICSETELGLGTDTSGIMVLSPDLEIGALIADALHLRDTVLNLGVTPNRADCFSVIGLAREIAAILDMPITIPAHRPEEADPPASETLRVEIRDPDLCPRYTARCVTDVTIAPSPLWMRRRLENCGIRSISNVVDITNYVLLEWGQPLHAFDSRTISDNCIIVRRARPGETFTTLDEVQRTPDSDVLMICDARGPVAVAGIMGGLDSGITAETNGVVLESAWFTPHSIARSSAALGLRSEASERFRKGVDPQGVVPAVDRAAQLMQRYCGGTVASGIVDCHAGTLPAPPRISLPVSRANSLIGTQLPQADMHALLQRLHMQVTAPDAETLAVTPPPWRSDVTTWVDLTEEIARLHGYHHIPATYPVCTLTPVATSPVRSAAGAVRRRLMACGCTEVINYSFNDPDNSARLGLPQSDARTCALPLRNPLSASQSVLRTSLVPSLLQNLRDNQRNGAENVKLFELGRVFFPQGDQPPQECMRLAGIAAGHRYAPHWSEPPAALDFYDIKGIVQAVLESLHIDCAHCAPGHGEPFLHPGAGAALYIRGTRAGSLGELHPAVLEPFDLAGRVLLFDLDFDLLCDYHVSTAAYQPFSRFPAIYRDLALVVDEQVSADVLAEAIRSFKNKYLQECVLFDCYRGESLPVGRKSLAFRLKFQADDRTLTDNEVNKTHTRLISFLEREVGAALR